MAMVQWGEEGSLFRSQTAGGVGRKQQRRAMKTPCDDYLQDAVKRIISEVLQHSEHKEKNR
jgi:hypothetical protein